MGQTRKEKRKEVMRLYEEEGLSPKEIAERQGVTRRAIELQLRQKKAQEEFEKVHKIIECARRECSPEVIGLLFSIRESTIRSILEKYSDLIQAEHYTEEDLRKRMGLDDMVPIGETEEDYKWRIEVKALGLYGYENVKTEVPHPFGKADIVICSDPKKIIEVKLHSDNDSIQKAIGQLLLASIAFPGAELFIACRQKIRKHFLDALHQLGIKQWEENN